MDIITAGKITASLYLSAVATKLWVCRQDPAYIAAAHVELGWVQVPPGENLARFLRTGARIVGLGMAVSLFFQAPRMLWHERLAYFRPYTREEVAQRILQGRPRP